MFARTIRLGRVAGIPIGAHWSLLVIGALLGVTLATGVLPATVDATTAAYWLAAAFAAALFFASVLVHELAHAVVARRHGVEVEDITLWILGGLARLRTDAPSARAQLQIALVGPLTSLLAGALFGAVAVGVSAVGAPEIAVVTLTWLALVNGVLAVFNMLPGAPLDGGRVLGALLWMRHGDRTRAAISASRAGRGVGYLLIGVGLANVLFGVGFGTLWTALIGWFILGASGAEEQVARTRRALAERTVADVMDRAPAVVAEWLTVDAVGDAGFEGGRDVALLQRFGTGEISGLVTRAALRSVPPSRRSAVRLADIARPKAAIRTLAPSDRADAILDALGAGPVVVLDGTQVVGVVEVGDVTDLVDAVERVPTA